METNERTNKSFSDALRIIRQFRIETNAIDLIYHARVQKKKEKKRK